MLENERPAQMPRETSVEASSAAFAAIEMGTTSLVARTVFMSIGKSGCLSMLLASALVDSCLLRSATRAIDVSPFAGAKPGDARTVAGIPFCWCPPGKFTIVKSDGAAEIRTDGKVPGQLDLTLAAGSVVWPWCPTERASNDTLIHVTE
jgi:hypothetical protein